MTLEEAIYKAHLDVFKQSNTKKLTDERNKEFETQAKWITLRVLQYLEE